MVVSFAAPWTEALPRSGQRDSGGFPSREQAKRQLASPGPALYEQEAGPLQLAELVACERSSSVGRTLHEWKGATSTLFTLDEGQGPSANATTFETAVYVVERNAEITDLAALHRVKRGDLIGMKAAG